MRVAMVGSEKLPIPPIRGGAVQTYISEVASLLSQKHEITIIGVCDEELPYEEVRDGIRYIRIQCTPNDPDSYARGLVERLEGENFDVIEVFNRPMNILPIHKVCPDSRLVLSLHNEMFRETKIPRFLAEPTLEVIDRIVTVSQYIADSVTARYPQAKDKIRTLYSGVSVEDYLLKGSPEATAIAEQTRRELGLKDGPVILYVGRLSRAKGPDRLIAALPGILERFPNANLLVVGGRWFGVSDPNDYVRELWESAKPVQDHIFFTGYVPHGELHRYFAVADVFVCTSQWAEPLARVHYEAMASGLPVVTTDRGGNAEIVQTGVHGIVLEEWDDPIVFASNILSILENPERSQAMGLAGRRMVEKFFTWERVARDLDQVLAEAASSTGKKTHSPIRLSDGIIQKIGQHPAHLLSNEMLGDTLQKVRWRTYHTLSLIDLLPRVDFGGVSPAEFTLLQSHPVPWVGKPLTVKPKKRKKKKAEKKSDKKEKRKKKKKKK